MKIHWLIPLLLLSGCAGLPLERDRVQVIEPAVAAELLRQRPDTFILDVSPPGDFEAGHLEGALNIPRSQLWFRMYEVPLGLTLPVLVVDTRGDRSLSAALAIRDEGYTRVYELKGGVKAWEEAGLPLAW